MLVSWLGTREARVGARVWISCKSTTKKITKKKRLYLNRCTLSVTNDIPSAIECDQIISQTRTEKEMEIKSVYFLFQ